VFSYYIPSTTCLVPALKFGVTRDISFLKPTGFHKCDNFLLCAFATERKVLILSCQDVDAPFVYEINPPPNTQAAFPLISWRKVCRFSSSFSVLTYDFYWLR
jgi:hypothetical protein